MTAPKIQGLHIERKIAKGGMAEVFLAEQKSLGRKVAVKVMDARTDDPEFAERFLQEAKLLAGLHHHNIITIYDFGRLDDARPYLSMEFLPGGDLEKRISRGVSEIEAIKILKELARALNFVHQHDIVHRDIKPANMLFRQDGSLVLTDFGIAKQVDNDVSRTRAGMTVGSPAYSSPEQAQGLPLDRRTDIYSVGVVLFEMLTGINPFKTDTHIDTAIKHIQMPVPRLPSKLSRYQPLVERMLAKNPRDRFGSMMEVLNYLDGLSGTSSAVVKPAADQLKLLISSKDKSKAFCNTMLQEFTVAMGKKIDQMMEISRSNLQQWQLLEVLRNLRKGKEELYRDFLGLLDTGFINFSRGEYSKDKSFQDSGDELSGKLTLLAHEELEHNIAASTMVRKLEAAHREELDLLHARLCAVIDKELPLESCPVGPYQVAHHFKQAIQFLQLEPSLAVQFFRIMEQTLSKELNTLYKDLNKMLADGGVLPKLTTAELQKKHQRTNKPQHEDNFGQWMDEQLSELDSNDAPPVRNMPAQTGSQRTDTHKHAQPDMPYQSLTTRQIVPDAALPSAMYQQQLFGAIRQMQQHGMAAMSGVPAASLTGGFQAMPPGEGWVPLPGQLTQSALSAVASQPTPVYTRNDLVSALNDMQGSVIRGRVDESLTDTGMRTAVKRFQEMRPGFLEPCPVQPLEVVMEAVAVVSPDEGDEPKQLHQEDSSSIDLVGMVFEYMLKDEELPDSVKALLSYLQVPYIKVALLDPELFAKPEHPARVLLNRLSEAGALWLNKEGYGQFRIFDEIKRVVNRILSEFSDSLLLFEELLREFETYTDTVKRRIEQLEKMTVQRAEAEQHVQNVKAYVHKRIKTRVTSQALPAPVVAMLMYPWFDYLTSVMLRFGEKSEQWHQGIQLVDNLLWSIKPKDTAHEIHRLKNLREILEKQIQAGFETIGFDHAKGQELLRKIAELQDRSMQAKDEFRPSAADTQEIERIQLDTAQREILSALPKPQDMTEDEQELVNKLKLIEYGTWFEFQQANMPEPQKLKVAWYNEENHSFLMVNSAGKQVAVMSALEIAQRMINRTGRMLSGSAKPFFERALEAIYKKMLTAIPAANQSGQAAAVVA